MGTRLLIRAIAGILLFGCLTGCGTGAARPTSTEESAFATGEDPRYLVLINKKHAVSESYDPANTVYVLEPAEAIAQEWVSPRKNGMELKLEGKTCRALDAMFRAMREDGVTDVYVTSAYRDARTQQSLFATYCQNELNHISQDAIYCLGEEYIRENYYAKGLLGLTPEDAETVASFYSAPAGYSEHQTGLCVDLITSEMKQLTQEFERSAAFAWLKENAHRFGFILRYPKDKETVTGYAYEPWHYRFVGAETAARIHASGVTLEEYLGRE